MTHLTPAAAVAASVLLALIASIVLRLLALLCPRGVTARLRQLATAQRPWHPKSPDDCPECAGRSVHPPADLVEVVPWKVTRSRSGAKKRVSSEGVACPNPACAYVGCAVESIHAMVSCGVRGKTDRIRRWKCQACGTTVTERKHTPLYRLKTPPGPISLVLALLANGLDPSAAARVFRYDHRTVDRWLSRAGKHAATLHNLYFRHLHCAFLQLDELVTTIRGDAQRTFVWTAIDAATKIIPHVHIGRRTINDAYAFVHGLAGRLAPGHVPLFSSDGLRHYFSALTAHYGEWQAPAPGQRQRTWHVDPRLVFGMLYKVKAGRRLKNLYSRIRCGSRKQWQAHTQALGFSGKVQTAFVERANLTLRELIAPLARRMWSLARSRESLRVAIQWGVCCYHFTRPHHSLRVSRAHDHNTPAMAAQVTDHRWTTEEILRHHVRYT
jgi:IS1 family transposase